MKENITDVILILLKSLGSAVGYKSAYMLYEERNAKKINRHLFVALQLFWFYCFFHIGVADLIDSQSRAV